MTDSGFNYMVDNLVNFAIEYDGELLSGIQWLDEYARKKGISFYDAVYEVLLRHDAQNKARDWMKQKNEDRN